MRSSVSSRLRPLRPYRCDRIRTGGRGRPPARRRLEYPRVFVPAGLLARAFAVAAEDGRRYGGVSGAAGCSCLRASWPAPLPWRPRTAAGTVASRASPGVRACGPPGPPSCRGGRGRPPARWRLEYPRVFVPAGLPARVSAVAAEDGRRHGGVSSIPGCSCLRASWPAPLPWRPRTAAGTVASRVSPGAGACEPPGPRLCRGGRGPPPARWRLEYPRVFVPAGLLARALAVAAEDGRRHGGVPGTPGCSCLQASWPAPLPWRPRTAAGTVASRVSPGVRVYRPTRSVPPGSS